MRKLDSFQRFLAALIGTGILTLVSGLVLAALQSRAAFAVFLFFLCLLVLVGVSMAFAFLYAAVTGKGVI